jgi:hypothetical protein
MVGLAAAKSVAMQALALGVLSLGDEEHLWLAATLLVLLSLARSSAV